MITDEMRNLVDEKLGYIDYGWSKWDGYRDETIRRIIELHEQSKPEPVGYAWIVGGQIQKLSDTKLNDSFIPLYTTPPTREPLSEHEVNNIVFNLSKGSTLFDFARLIEQAHGIGATND